ncbi:hypothetical protein ACFS32_06950 [Novosphingobium pokkalii]|uniref:hypothetical protein n=1 Tax=Novosphingobium pokkalii TaxID=1770194 RepID=UPI003630A58E
MPRSRRAALYRGGRARGARRGVPSLVRLWPDTPMLALRATLALERYGAQDSYGLA